MAAVDYCPPTLVSTAGYPASVPAPKGPAPAAAAAEYTCSACAETFASLADHRAHFKSERHVYNTKRRQAGLKPISQEAWERKLRESRGAEQNKGTAHLKAKKQKSKAGAGSETASSRGTGTDVPSEVVDEPLTPRRCLFDRQRFESVDECVAYMEKTHSFFIPDQEYCTDVVGLLSYLGEKISAGVCINCNRRFPDLASVRRHMTDKGHCQIGSEAYTRRGNYDEAGTEELRAELEDFYDFHASMREVSEKITDPKQKVASILRFFDADHDGVLNRQEVEQLWAAATDGAELTEVQYLGACSKVGAEPEEGLDLEALGRLYAEDVADLDVHFNMLQDLLIRKRRRPKEKLEGVEEGDENEDEDEAKEGAENEDEAEDGESSEDEVLEVEDEDEFEEIMRVLGLQPVAILPNGDLRLPNGGVATHRDVQHIYRQRGNRPDQLALTAGQNRVNPRGRTQLMLSNAGAGCLKMAVSKRQEAKEGKKIIAVLRRKQHSEMRLGMKQNVLQTKNGVKIRTGRGDMSAGR
mmetsp:Transcript_155337/g.289807  ORF Transcript_155337/g.289807 Transcript_155337/m.289807 type:complete len:525 (+) Transcript_155337:74-1648(+)